MRLASSYLNGTSTEVDIVRRALQHLAPILSLTRGHGFVLRASAAIVLAVFVVFMWNGSSVAKLRSAMIPSVIVPQETPIQGVSIANNGHVHIKGARVIQVSEFRLVAASELNGGTFRWTTTVNEGTRVVLPGGELGSLVDIDKGEYVSISGMMTGESSAITIAADTLRLLGDESDSGPVVRLEKLP